MLESIIFLLVAIFLVAIGVWYLVSLNKSEKQLTEEKLRKHSLSFEDRWNMEKHIAAVKGVRIQGIVLALFSIGLAVFKFWESQTYLSLDFWAYLFCGSVAFASLLFGFVSIRAVRIFQKVEKL